MLYRNIILSFSLCVILTFISTSINRPNSSAFFPAFVLGIGAYILMFIIAFVTSKLFSLTDTTAFIISFLTSYVGLMLILWSINGGGILNSLQKLHYGKDFLGFLLPFILSNIALIIWTIIKRKT